MAERAKLVEALRNADAAGDTEAATTLAKALKGMPDKSVPDSPDAVAAGPEAETPLADKIQGGADAALTLLSAPVGGAAGAAAGLFKGVTGGKYGTPEGGREASARASEVAQKFTYEPRSATGKDYLDRFGKLFDASKLGGLNPAEVPVMARGAAPAAEAGATVARAAAPKAAEGIKDAVSALRAPPGKEMVGVGSALTDAARIRRERADALPVPIKLTKGQAERTFEQQQFERETAKNPDSGKPLRERYADQNEKILQNFDAWVDQTGAQSGSIRATGQVVTDAIASKAKKAKSEINAAYADARSEMGEQIDVAPLTKYVADHQAEAINAPVISSVEAKIASLAKDGGISINDLEEVRKMVGKLGGKDATNATFAGEIKSVIDQLTEGKGGEKYKKARALRASYGKEFEDVGVIDKMLSTKPGTRDRSVAYEDVFNHSILKGSLDDVRAVRKTLQTAGPEGQQAWKELQGETVKHMKERITKNVATDVNGNRVVSPAELDKMVTELDKDGKLDFIFGKQGAQQIRDVNDLAKDVFTAPPGSVNTSNTASILIGLLDTAVSGVTGVPLPIGTAVNYGVKRVKKNRLDKKVNDALSQSDVDAAGVGQFA